MFSNSEMYNFGQHYTAIIEQHFVLSCPLLHLFMSLLFDVVGKIQKNINQIQMIGIKISTRRNFFWGGGSQWGLV